MNELVFNRKRWAPLFSMQLLIALAVATWFMFDKRRQVLEENADRLLKISH